MKNITKKAVFVGRFQPLHKGHKRAIENKSKEYGLVIAVGSPEKSRTERNPLSYSERKKLLDDCFPELEKIPVQDEDRGEEGYPAWGRRLIQRTDADTVITRNDTVIDIIEDFTDAEIVEHAPHKPEKYSGKRIREKIRGGDRWKGLVPDCSQEKTSEYEAIVEETV